MTGIDITALQTLPPLWTTEGTETQDIVLGLRFTCSWHGLNWFPIEYDSELAVAYGLTVKMVPAWRHFHQSELTSTYSGQSVNLDGRFVGGRVPLVPHVKQNFLDDITPFYAAPVPNLP